MGVTMTQPPRSLLVGPYEDVELRLRFAQGDPAAFDRIVRVYGPELQRLARRLLGWPDPQGAEDALQEALMSAFTHCRSFRADSSLRTWLTRITINSCRATQRRCAARAALLQRLMFWRRQEAAASKECGSDAQAVQAALRTLRAKDREIIVLHYLEEMSIGQIANLLRVTPGAVHTRLHRVRKRLTGLLGAYVEDSK